MDNSAIAICTVVADIIISLSYFAIPVEIWFFQRSLTRPLPFKFILVFFELFIFACGLTHLVGVWVPWSRSDPLLLASKALCAVISLTTALVMVTVIPKVFSFPARAALMEEELGLRIRHEHSLQKSIDLLIKFRKITNTIRRTLDIGTICDSAVTELCQNLQFTGMALFLPMDDGEGYVCQAEFIKSTASKVRQYQTHYWKTISIDPTTATFLKISSVSCACYLSAIDLVVLANKQRGMLYRSGLAMSFQADATSRGFIIAFNENDAPALSEEDAELFEDIVGQIEIALTQARQIQKEHLHLSALERQLQDNATLDRAKHSAETSSRVKTHLLASMGQEIMAPVNDIRGLASFLKGTVISPGQQNALDLLLLRSKSLDIIMDDLADFVKIDDNGLLLEQAPLIISECLQDSLSKVQDISAQKQWPLSSQIEDNVPQGILGDSRRLRQIIANILSNIIAVAPTSGDARVTVSLSPDPPRDIPFLADPNCFKFSHHLNPAPRERSPLRPRIFFHIVGLDHPSPIVTKPTLDWIKGVGVSPLRPGLGLTVVAHLIQLFDGDLTMRSCANQGTIYSFSVCCPIFKK